MENAITNKKRAAVLMCLGKAPPDPKTTAIEGILMDEMTGAKDAL
jgi:hypothetical protein